MNILHLCLSGPMTEGLSYQENMLSRQNVRDGHNVTVIASTLRFIDGKEGHVDPCDTVLPSGVRLIRLPFCSYGPRSLTDKMRRAKGLRPLLCQLKPDVILFHDVSSISLRDVVRYVKKNPGVRLFLDNHGDAHNSAKNFISRCFLHRFLYRRQAKSAMPYTEKVLCISDECLSFARDNYRIPEQKLAWYPLGCVCPTPEEIRERGMKKREELGIPEDARVFTHSGKMDSTKKTLSVIRAFSAIPDEKNRLVIAGSLLPEIEEEAMRLVAADERILFIGWQNADQMTDLLSATDVYLQPGTQSATMQNALGAACAVVLYPYESHYRYLSENGIFVRDEDELHTALLTYSSMPAEKLAEEKERSYRFAAKTLDYRALAKWLY